MFMHDFGIYLHAHLQHQGIIRTSHAVGGALKAETSKGRSQDEVVRRRLVWVWVSSTLEDLRKMAFLETGTVILRLQMFGNMHVLCVLNKCSRYG